MALTYGIPPDTVVVGRLNAGDRAKAEATERVVEGWKFHGTAGVFVVL